MTDEEKKAIEFVKFYKQYCLNKELANIENYETVNDEEFVHKNLEIVLNLIEKQEKIINEMAKHIENDKDYMENLDWYYTKNCFLYDTMQGCRDDCKECIIEYFTKKVGE